MFWGIGLSFDDLKANYTAGCQDFRRDGDVGKLHARYSHLVIDAVVFLYEVRVPLEDLRRRTH
jgi:hypothetical protein